MTSIHVTRTHRQSIQYILPSESIKLAQAELVAIDEAAAIPLPIVKSLLGSYTVFMSSTVNGYEGTGRALSLKLIQQLRVQQGAAVAEAARAASHDISGSKNKKGERKVHEERWKAAAEAAASYINNSSSHTNARTLKELTLDTPIRYAAGDPIEKWLNGLLCLDMTTHSQRLVNVLPAPRDCDLYMVNRDALFSYHKLSESLLQRIWALYTSAHYKNTPNDLQMLSDAPAHRLFVLLGPQKASSTQSNNGASKPVLPDVLCVLQIAFEGFISRQSVQSELMKANKASGDMIPWTISQQFNDSEFATLSGARIVRIATHPDVQKMGYGSRAVDLLIQYFQGELSAGSGPSPAVGTFGGEGAGDADDSAIHAIHSTKELPTDNDGSESSLLQESVVPRKKLPSLLTPVSERPCERLHWLGVSFGLTTQLLNFWTRKSFKTCYLRQTANDLTGEHSAILLRELNCDGVLDAPVPGWVNSYVTDYRRRLVSLMSYAFGKLETVLAITLVDPDRRLTSAVGSTGDVGADDAVDGTEETSAGQSSTTNTTGAVLDSSVARLTVDELLTVHLSHHDLKRLDLYARNMVDHHMILDTIPVLARLVFLSRIQGLRFSYLQVAILLATGLQHRDVDEIAKELDIPVSQVLAFFNKTIRKIATHLRELVEKHVSKELIQPNQVKNLAKRSQEQMNAAQSTVGSLLDEHRNDVADFNQKNQQAKKSASTAAAAGSSTPGGGAKQAVSLPSITLTNVQPANDDDLAKAWTQSAKKMKSDPTSVSVPVVPTSLSSSSMEPNRGHEKGKDKHKSHNKHNAWKNNKGNHHHSASPK